MCAGRESIFANIPSPACGGGGGPQGQDRGMRPHPFPLSRERERGNGQSRCALLTQRGATLIEVVLFIVIISTALCSVLGTLSLTVGRSADPLVARQALAIAESL